MQQSIYSQSLALPAFSEVTWATVLAEGSSKILFQVLST